MRPTPSLLILLALSSVVSAAASDTTTSMNDMKRLARDHVSMTKEAANLRSKHLQRKKPILQKSVSITSLLFPGTEPIEYTVAGMNMNKKEDKFTGTTMVPMFVEYVESRKTPIGVDYYELPVCPKPPSSAQDSTIDSKTTSTNKRKNLGQRLMGHSTQPLGYEIPTKINKSCTILCHQTLQAKQIRLMQKLIQKQYRVHFTLDSLPILVRSQDLNHAIRGYPLGFVISDASSGSSENHGNVYYLNNHLRFTIYYNDNTSIPLKKIHITGFDVKPVSIQHSLPESGWDDGRMQQGLTSCNASTKEIPGNVKETFLPVRTGAAGEDMEVIYSYEVIWKHSEIEWSDRWDIYMMETPDNEVHYFAIVNSLMIGFLLCGTVAVIMIRALRKDINRYNEFDIEDYNTPVEESGWKLVHSDVFRPPKKGRTLLSVAVGTGLQIGTSVAITLIAAVLRLLNPMKKGQILSFVIFAYVLSGSVAGYASARLFKFFAGKAWKRTTLLTAAAFPAVLLTLFLTLNIGLYISLGKVSTSVSYSTVLIAFLLWICVSSPLVLVGSYFGYKQDKIEVPTKTSHIARFIPESRSWFVKFPHSALLAGILPFGSVCIELSFIMGALWLHQIYYIMGFIMIVCTILTISCSTVSMVFCYVQLCNEHHKWWWRSFYNCASIGLYLFLYSLWYLVTKLELVGLWPLLVYSLYMGIISFACALYCGGVGVVSSFWFVRKIYGAVKVD